MKALPPLTSVGWESAAAALETLTAALGDAEAGGRIAAAKAFSSFIMFVPAASAKPVPDSAEAILSGYEAIRSGAGVILSDAKMIMSDAKMIMGGAEAILSGD